MKMQEVPFSELKPYENNPRVIDDAIPDVVESIKQVGYITPIVVDENMVILAGHTRYEALRRLGTEKVRVIIAEGMTDEQKRKYRLLDNKTNELATWDNEELKRELFNVDFQGYDFGQPKPSQGKADEPETVTCPCCGEVFKP